MPAVYAVGSAHMEHIPLESISLLSSSLIFKQKVEWNSYQFGLHALGAYMLPPIGMQFQ